MAAIFNFFRQFKTLPALYLHTRFSLGVQVLIPRLYDPSLGDLGRLVNCSHFFCLINLFMRSCDPCSGDRKNFINPQNRPLK